MSKFRNCRKRFWQSEGQPGSRSVCFCGGTLFILNLSSAVARLRIMR